MTLLEFLSTFKTDTVQITLIDGGTNEEIITFKAPGYASLEDELEAREIKEWSIINPIAVKVILKAETTEP